MDRSTNRGTVLAGALALVLGAGLLFAPASIAHSFTKTDGNDSPGRLDIKAASVKHGATAVIHSIRTYEGWTVASLGDDSFFVIGIDTNRDNDFEKCAIILKVRALRGALTNCRSGFIRSLNVAKPSAAAVNVKIPEGQFGDYYRWAAFSYWTGAPAGCADTCPDAVPNVPPPILHDLASPLVTMETSDLRVGVTSTSADFEFPFTVTDDESGVGSWKVQSRPVSGSTTWTTVKEGSGGGARSPVIHGTEGASLSYRVVAMDEHGNRKIGPTRRVLVPVDDDQIDPEAFTGEPETVVDADAFGGTYQVLDHGESVTFMATEFDELVFELMGPGTGDWEVDVTLNDSLLTTIDAAGFDESQRQLLLAIASGDSTMSISFAVTAGSGFGIDSFVMPI